MLPVVMIVAIRSTSAADQFLFLAASRDNALVSYAVDPDSGELRQQSVVKLPGTGGPMSLSADGKFVYVESHIAKDGGDSPRPHIVTLKNDGGRLTQIHVAEVRLRSPSIHVDGTGKNLLGAHYGEGKVSVWKINDDRICTGELLDDQSTGERAHFIVTDPGNRFVYVPHTLPNSVFQFAFNADTGKLAPLDPPFAKGPDADHQYHEPRHYAHHPTLPMGYTSNEHGGGISSWDFNTKTGVLTLKQTLSSLPPNWEGGSAAADIHITPNGRFVYVSNRDTRTRDSKTPPGDTLAGFEIDLKTGDLRPIGHFPVENHPRSFCIDTTGNFLYAAGQLSNKLAAYRIAPESGQLARIGTYETGETPIWIMCWSE